MAQVKSGQRAMRALAALGICGLAITGAGGCVERTLTIQSTPNNSLVTLNDQEVGRTPMSIDFTYYGDYDVTLRHPGGPVVYDAMKTRANVKEPWFQIPPLDLFAALLPIPFKDHQTFTYVLSPQGPLSVPELMQRADYTKSQLEGTRQPPTTGPSVIGGPHTPKHHAATRPSQNENELDAPTTAPDEFPAP